MPNPNISLSTKELKNAEAIEKDLRRRLAIASKEVARLFRDTRWEDKLRNLGY